MNRRNFFGVVGAVFAGAVLGAGEGVAVAPSGGFTLGSWEDARLGSLDGLYVREFVADGVRDNFGFAVGNDLCLDVNNGFSGATFDRVNGLRLFNMQEDDLPPDWYDAWL